MAAALALYALLAVPASKDALGAAFIHFPLEWAVIVLGVLVWPGTVRAIPAVAIALSVVIVLVSVLKAADIAMLTSLNRPFNAVVDMFLVRAGLNVLQGSIGTAATGLVIAFGALFLIAIGFALYLALRSIAAVTLAGPARALAATGLFAALLLSLADLVQARGAWQAPVDLPGTAVNARVVAEHLVRGKRAAADLEAFSAAAALDPYADRTDLFDRSAGRDVIFIYIESYGRSSIDNPLYAGTHVPKLARAEGILKAAGYAMQTGWLTSPTVGGQSWLAHGTLASGLRTTDQSLYGAMLASDRQSLFHLAQASGFRTAAVMPAITLAWPEALRMGFDTVLAAEDLHYAGQPFNWVTMPDQYTLSAFEKLLPADPRDDFLQIALISSHAPWVPVPQMIAWEEVGDGRVFDRWATSGDSPAVVWRDRDRVRDQYRMAIDYALEAAFGYVARRADLPLFVILGDHQPAGFVAGIESRDVPVHLIGPPELVALAAAWGWRDGLVPDADTPVWPMEAFRDRFIRAYTTTLTLGSDM
jgi:hypothetical protein